MLLVASYDFTGSVIVHIVGTEYGLGIVGTEGVELLQIIAEFGSDIPEVDFGIDVRRWSVPAEYAGIRILRNVR